MFKENKWFLIIIFIFINMVTASPAIAGEGKFIDIFLLVLLSIFIAQIGLFFVLKKAKIELSKRFSYLALVLLCWPVTLGLMYLLDKVISLSNPLLSGGLWLFGSLILPTIYAVKLYKQRIRS